MEDNYIGDSRLCTLPANSVDVPRGMVGGHLKINTLSKGRTELSLESDAIEDQTLSLVNQVKLTASSVKPPGANSNQTP